MFSQRMTWTSIPGFRHCMTMVLSVDIPRAGKKYCEILAWAKHQNPHCKEAASTIPAPCEHHAGTGNTGASPADSLIPDSLIPDSGISDSGIPDSEKMPAPVETRGGADIPADLHPLNYAAKICEELGIPVENSNLRSFAGAIDALVKSGKSLPAAYEYLLARAIDEKELGPVTWTFWCRDGRFNFPAGASPTNGQRPTDSQFMGQMPASTPCPLKFCDGSGWYVEQSTRRWMNCECQSVNVGVSG
jgi:hypothetical protein